MRTETIKSSDFIKVYRIEHRVNRGGPFRVEENSYLRGLDGALSRHVAPQRWSAGDEDFGNLKSLCSFYEDAEYYRFGFRSLKSLKSVFHPEDVKLLEENGYRVVELEVSKRESFFGPQGQVCFIDPRLFAV